MKKIVALVLSLVMVLGLATVAFGYEDEKTYYLGDATNTPVVYVAADYDAETGAGDLEFFTDGTNNYVPCAKGTTGAVAVYAAAGALAGDPVLGYVKAATGVVSYNVTGTAVAKSTLSCTTDGHAKGYYDAINDDYYVVDTTIDASTVWMKVGDKIIGVEAMSDVVYASHILYQYKSEKVSDGVFVYKCAACGATFNMTADPSYAPAKAEKYVQADAAAAVAAYTAAGYAAMVDHEFAGTNLYFVDSVVDAETDKVESAETFDAGIAMYVGMSVMAAAGSAVVLKKKD